MAAFVIFFALKVPYDLPAALFTWFLHTNKQTLSSLDHLQGVEDSHSQTVRVLDIPRLRSDLQSIEDCRKTTLADSYQWGQVEPKCGDTRTRSDPAKEVSRLMQRLCSHLRSCVCMSHQTHSPEHPRRYVAGEKAESGLPAQVPEFLQSLCGKG